VIAAIAVIAVIAAIAVIYECALTRPMAHAIPIIINIIILLYTGMGIFFTHKLIMCKQNCIGFSSGPGSGPGVFCKPDRTRLFGSNWRCIWNEMNERNGSWSMILRFYPSKCSIRFGRL
jgi:hypothetical protein